MIVFKAERFAFSYASVCRLSSALSLVYCISQILECKQFSGLELYYILQVILRKNFKQLILPLYWLDCSVNHLPLSVLNPHVFVWNHFLPSLWSIIDSVLRWPHLKHLKKIHTSNYLNFLSLCMLKGLVAKNRVWYDLIIFKHLNTEW